MFCTKDKLMLKSIVVYKFNCATRNSCYVSYMTRHIYQHLIANAECKNACEISCFEIIDYASNEYELKSKKEYNYNGVSTSVWMTNVFEPLLGGHFSLVDTFCWSQRCPLMKGFPVFGWGTEVVE